MYKQTISDVQVIILESTTAEQIHVYELEVYSLGDHNIAPNGVASQDPYRNSLHIEIKARIEISIVGM